MTDQFSAKNAEIDDVQWLLENAALALAAHDVPTELVQRLTRFRKRYGAERGRLLSELCELRERGRTKFTRADRMFFTARALEQSTDEVLASYKGSRFRGRSHVADFCCGLGGDALGLAAAVQNEGSLTLIDKSAMLLEYAVANVRTYEPDATLRPICEDLRNCRLAEYQAWHFDPDRRPDNQRRSEPDGYEPALSEFLALPELTPHGGIKLAPGAEVEELLDQGFELEWIGHRRECQQQVAWRGDLAKHAGKRVATWLSQTADGNLVSESLVEDSSAAATPFAAPLAASVQRYLYEPRPSVLAAGLDDTLAQQYGLRRLTTGAAYYVSDQLLPDTELAVGFEVLDAMPFHRKTLARRLGELNCQVTEVKKRGVSLQPAKLLREFRGEGDCMATLILYPVGEAVQVIIARRLA